MIKSTQFRKELQKIMPGYKWTIHRQYSPDAKYLCATGIQTAGYNRTSTLQIIVSEKNGLVEYDSKSSGFGLKSPWLSSYEDSTLAKSLRGLQQNYADMASNYSRHAYDLENARKTKPTDE